MIGKLIQSFELGNAIKQGVNTVIAGRPNAGKSTLLNALLNEDRAIVSHIAGTTRDTIEEVLNINGINFRLIDTAGLREATDTIEAIGVQKTLEKISQSALLLYVFDAENMSVTDVEQDIKELLHPGLPVIAIANKIDLLPGNQLAEYFTLTNGVKIVTVSAREKQHVDYLKQTIYNNAVQGKLNANETLVTNIRHLEALQKTEQALIRVINGIDNPVTSDFLAMDIKQALHYLGEITGAVTTDDLLDNIFSKFCIGK
jgi:tRNA modification GTPase